MFVYWGSNDSGKSHLKNYAKLNNKTNLLWLNHEIRKIKTQTHIDEITWREETIHRIIYHNLDNELRKCDKKERRIWRHAEHIHRDSSINPDKIQYGPRNPLVKKKKRVHKRPHQKIYSERICQYNSILRYDTIIWWRMG